MNIKKGDMVLVIAGKDRGKTGKVLRSLPKRDLVVVEGVNLRKKHQRPSKKSQKGQIIDKTMPVHVSNVSLVDQKTGGRTRIRIDRTGGRRVRIAKKSGAAFS